MLRGGIPSRRFGWLLRIVVGIAVLALPLSWLGIDLQRNGMWIGLLLPIHLALAALWAGRRRDATMRG